MEFYEVFVRDDECKGDVSLDHVAGLLAGCFAATRVDGFTLFLGTGYIVTLPAKVEVKKYRHAVKCLFSKTDRKEVKIIGPYETKEEALMGMLRCFCEGHVTKPSQKKRETKNDD